MDTRVPRVKFLFLILMGRRSTVLESDDENPDDAREAKRSTLYRRQFIVGIPFTVMFYETMQRNVALCDNVGMQVVDD